MKKFKATYLVNKTGKEYVCDVFAMDKKQAWEMYQSNFMTLIGLECCGIVD